MHRRKAGTRLHWKGFESVGRVENQLAKRRSVNIRLPDSYHHVLSVRLAPPVQPDGNVRVHGGPELLDKIAGVVGLHDFADLVEPARAADAMVHVSSPPAQIQLVPHVQ